MANRDIKDAVKPLQDAYAFAKSEYQKLYPNEPQPFLTCVFRSDEEQTQLYAIGRTVKGKIVTNAKAGQSKHNKKPSEAFDIAFITIDKKLSWKPIYFKRFADIIKTKGIKWGGNFKSIPDAPHFEV
jgi:peptidoglycan L-alanyl-D-glutamate endopeptidase CwlK